MSKDPAFLFYSNDFICGTFTMTNEQVGMYIRLLCLQHSKESHRLSEKDMMNICKSYDEDVFSKFEKDEDGMYFNRRLDGEISRRKQYSEGRRNNRMLPKVNTINDSKMKNICLTCVNHMGTETETITINEICNKCYKKSEYKKAEKRKSFEPPTMEEVVTYFNQNGYSSDAAKKFFAYYSEGSWHDGKGDKIKNWKQKAQAVWFKDEYKVQTAKRPH